MRLLPFLVEAWRSIGSASYNALQVNLKKVYSQGIQFDFNYTYSKSIDQQSDAERVDAWSGLSGNIINSWSPDALRGVSDFDNAHQINANFLAELPFGKGKPVAPNAGGFLNAVIGGWQLSGLARRRRPTCAPDCRTYALPGGTGGR